ncbi:MAG TPA: N-acetylmuramoyl-L-alanine amidase [Candidatus Baltobacteraceae bacterium]|nr:N-acetylmuramoyl-L-alanine amidase [Candidatus Baltobacteraceae bacterium]
MNRFAARIGSACAIFVLLATTVVRADTVSYAFERSSITFTHITHTGGATAIGIDDPALRSLLKALGAALTWRAGDRTVLIATSAPEVISFGVGDDQYSIGALTAQAGFAPYMNGTEVYLPFDDLMRALGVAPAGGVLERLLTSVDVEGYGPQAVVVARGGGILHGRAIGDTPDHLVYEFDGVGTTLAPERTVNAGGIRDLQITSEGSVRDPKTYLSFDLAPNTRHDPPQSGSGEFEIAFGANGSAPPLMEPLRESLAVAGAAALAVVAEATTAPAPVVTASPLANAPAAANATVDSVSVSTLADGSETVAIGVTGDASYEWHRLRAPDDRFWIDIKNAQLAGGPLEQAEANPLIALRVRQIDPQTVRVALSLAGDTALAVSPSASGITVNVGTTMVGESAPREGTGTIGAVVSANEPQPSITPVPADEYGASNSGDDTSWKFGPRGYVPTNPKLIVIDPGHGGDDRGSVHGDLQEAVLTLDMAKRVQSILIARGWQVKMTRTTDHDVDATPTSTAEAKKMGYDNDAADDLQARDDIANESGARLFVSIHCNAYINSGPNGTTVYYYKPIDQPLAQIMDRDIAMAGLAKDDGIVKEHLYVTAHADMPAVLIETAFLTNPGDYAKLSSPDWRAQMAQAIANGIDQYAREYPVVGSTQQ